MGSRLLILVHKFRGQWEFLLWHSGIGSVSAAPGCRFHPWPVLWLKGSVVATGLDLILDLGTPYLWGGQKEEKKMSAMKLERIFKELLNWDVHAVRCGSLKCLFWCVFTSLYTHVSTTQSRSGTVPTLQKGLPCVFHMSTQRAPEKVTTAVTSSLGISCCSSPYTMEFYTLYPFVSTFFGST